MITRPAIERFEEKIERIPFSGCWIWTGAFVGGGYGQMRIGGGGKTIPTHRFSYGHFIAPIPSGLLVCHRCDVPACCNPAHLFLGTHKDNSHDRDMKLRAGVSTNGMKTHCPRGHAYTPENTARPKSAHGRVCRACKRYFRGRKIQPHPMTACDLVRIDGEGRFRSGLFKCAECAREVRQHMNHLGRKAIFCDGVKTSHTSPHDRAFDALARQFDADISANGR